MNIYIDFKFIYYFGVKKCCHLFVVIMEYLSLYSLPNRWSKLIKLFKLRFINESIIINKSFLIMGEGDLDPETSPLGMLLTRTFWYENR